ncbi:MAG: hypothetical protein KF861_24005 [Planctomycetaceae bacterium]|nr:hypothetical protein [Planctomycetaceae bacterium]
MPAVKPQAVSGVSAGRETMIETVYPSIAASGIGKAIGMVCDSIPLRIAGVKLSYLLFGPLMVPFALIGYTIFKLADNRYVVTNRSVRVLSSLGDKMKTQVSLSDIDQILVNVQPGQAFYHAGDLILLKANGDELLKLPGVPRPARLRQVILDARQARLLSDASLATINKRQPA